MSKRNLMAALSFGTMVVLMVSGVQGQDRGTSLSPALALARICVSEANWECFTRGDGLAIHEVLLRGAERHGMSYVSFARAYSGRVVGDRVPTGERGRWLRELSPDGSAPPSWPRHTFTHRAGVVDIHPAVPWSHYRADWLAVYARAQEVVRNFSLSNIDEWGVCEAPVHDWGGSMDRLRAERLRLIEIECGETANDFYARPSLVAEAEEEEPVGDDSER